MSKNLKVSSPMLKLEKTTSTGNDRKLDDMKNSSMRQNDSLFLNNANLSLMEQTSESNSILMNMSLASMMVPSQPVVQFDIHEHEILKKQDCVIYHINIFTKSQQWVVQTRYNNFRELNNKLIKYTQYKDKIPPFPPKRLNRKSAWVIDERKRLLAEYMNRLSQSINVFRDEEIMKFLCKDYNQVQIQTLASIQDNFLRELNDQSLNHSISQSMRNSVKSSFRGTKTRQSQTQDLLALQGDLRLSHISIPNRKRGMSDEIDESGGYSPLPRSASMWRERKFDTLEEKLNSFLEELHKQRDNQSQLITDFQDYYFGEKPMIPSDHLKRLFFGYLKHKGLIDHLKECHLDKHSIKTKSVMGLFPKMLDHNKSHQVEELTEIWKGVKPKDLQDCQFDLLVKDTQQTIKDACFNLLKIYLDGKLFKCQNIIKDEIFVQKYEVWVKNKNRHQNSFTSTSSLGQHTPTSQKCKKGKSYNSFICDKPPHFGACNHSKTRASRGQIGSESPEDGQCVDSQGSDKLSVTKQRSAQTPSKRIKSHFANSSRQMKERDGILDSYSSSMSDSNSDYLFDEQYQREARQKVKISVQVTVPRDIITPKRLTQEDEENALQSNNTGILQTNSNELAENQRIVDKFHGNIQTTKFDLAQEIQDLIKHYNRRLNHIYHTAQIEDLAGNEIYQKINEYIFDQNHHQSGYKIQLSNFRRLIEGQKPQMMNLQESLISSPIGQFFNDIGCQVIQEIDENNKLIKYTVKRRKISEDFLQYQENLNNNNLSLSDQKLNIDSNEEEQHHIMLVSYNLTGLNKDKANISMFEFDTSTNTINPANFITVSQSVSKSSSKTSFSSMTSKNTQESKNLGTGNKISDNSSNIADNQLGNLSVYRALSAVIEDPEDENISISIKASLLKKISGQSGQGDFSPAKQPSKKLLNLLRKQYSKESSSNIDSLDSSDQQQISPLVYQEEQKDDQDNLLFESNFNEDDLDDELRDIKLIAEHQQIQSQSAKCSFSTSKSSNHDARHVQWTDVNNKACNQNHKFDETLSQTYGDVSVIMRIADDQILLDKILSLFKGLASQINLSLHGIK